MRNVFLAMALVAGLALTAPAKPELPLRLTLNYQAAATPDDSPAVVVRVDARAEFSNVKAAVILPENLVPADDQQRLSWKFDVGPEASFEQKIALVVPDAGEYALTARFVAKTGEALIKLKRPLYLIVAEDVTVASSVSPTQARRLAILERYRIDNDLPEGQPLDLDALPPDVKAALAALNEAEADPAVAAPKRVSQPGDAPDQPEYKE